MADRTRSLVIALDNEYRIEDIDLIINAIKMIKGVADVVANEFEGSDTMNAWAAKQAFLNNFRSIVLNATYANI
jgi:hypothetical protein